MGSLRGICASFSKSGVDVVFIPSLQDDWERNMISRRIFSVEQFNYWLGTGGPFGGIVLEYLLPCPGRKFLIEGGRYCIPTDLFIEKLKAGMFKMQ